jgi:hypothetical protein
MLASLVVLLIIVGCAVLQFLKGTAVRAIAGIIIAIIANIAAFSFFEAVAGMLIKRGTEGMFLTLAPWAQSLSFALIFIIIFAVLQTITIYLTREEVNLGLWPERIGRIVCGLILGLIVSGVLMTTLVMAPLPSKYPYQRFDSANVKLDDPGKVLFNIDAFVSGLFGTISNGSLSGQRSFSSIHPNFLDQHFLNRLTKDVAILSSNTPAIEVPREKAVWPASETLKKQIEELNSKGELSRTLGKPKGSYNLTIVRIGFRKSAMSTKDQINAGVFTTSQLRLICKRRGEEPLSGKGINIFPIGYLKAANQIETGAKIELDRTRDFGEASKREIDFVFCVPNDYVPAFVEFKQNSIAEIREDAIIKDISEAPSPSVYVPASEGGGPRGGDFPEGGFPEGSFPGRRGSGRRGQGQPPDDAPESKAEQLTESITGAGIQEEMGY